MLSLKTVASGKQRRAASSGVAYCVAAALTLAAAGYRTEGVTTIGANFNLAPTVVVKADVQRYKVNADANRFNLGLGFAF